MNSLNRTCIHSFSYLHYSSIIPYMCFFVTAEVKCNRRSCNTSSTANARLHIYIAEFILVGPIE